MKPIRCYVEEMFALHLGRERWLNTIIIWFKWNVHINFMVTETNVTIEMERCSDGCILLAYWKQICTPPFCVFDTFSAFHLSCGACCL